MVYKYLPSAAKFTTNSYRSVFIVYILWAAKNTFCPIPSLKNLNGSESFYYFFHKMHTAWTMSEYRFSLTRIFPYINRILDSETICEDKGQRKTVFWNISRSGSYSSFFQTFIQPPSSFQLNFIHIWALRVSWP